MQYEFRTKPYPHQLKYFEESKDLLGYAVFWEQGTGKSKFMVDNASYLFQKGEISAVLLVASTTVLLFQWVEEAIQDHMPLETLKLLKAHVYKSKKAKTKRHKGFVESLMNKTDSRFPWLCMTYDAFVTVEGKKAAKKFFASHDVLMILDESPHIKTPGAKRTKTFIAASKYPKYKRILTGTPATNGPFDLFSQIKFLDKDFWKQFQLDTYFGFKYYFGIWQKGYNSQQEREFEFCTGYRHVEKLKEFIQPISSRVNKDVLGLPPKHFSKRYFEMSEEQFQAYNNLKNDFMTMVGEDLITATLAIVRLIRFQQITSCFLPNIEKEIIPLSEENPRLECLMEVVEQTFNKTIIWARFTHDIDIIMEKLKDAGFSAVRYDGKVKDEERGKNKKAFQWKSMEDGGPQFFVGNPQAASEGLDLWAANTVIYYNNTFKLKDRLQSEDRAHRKGTTSTVFYIDILAKNTVDEKIVSSLRSKFNIASQITGDVLKDWI